MVSAGDDRCFVDDIVFEYLCNDNEFCSGDACSNHEYHNSVYTPEPDDGWEFDFEYVHICYDAIDVCDDTGGDCADYWDSFNTNDDTFYYQLYNDYMLLVECYGLALSADGMFTVNERWQQCEEELENDFQTTEGMTCSQCYSTCHYEDDLYSYNWYEDIADCFYNADNCDFQNPSEISDESYWGDEEDEEPSWYNNE